ncbi:hypothetical protein CI610_00508 [invertebrate metagenome]|uniref:DUF2147 domain-containing protein n=1 Tax=invertebrate metagenome TaxID=1711999 RepID=A0A2H9TB61_9ZZZZ
MTLLCKEKTLKKTVQLITGSCLLAVSSSLFAAINNSPVGLWKTIDDNTGEAKSLVYIQQQDDKLIGTVKKILTTGKQDSLCIECKGDLKDQKIEGMTIIWDMQPKEDPEKYDNGKILDPETGKIYSANMTVQNNGENLKVRGYIGFSLLGRSQIWERVHRQ